MLHPTFIYGPLSSRRLGNSLGINLLPTGRKVCNFECVYCECGWTDIGVKSAMPTRETIHSELESTLKGLHSSSQTLAHITFAGNGEPTLHKEFDGIIDDTIGLRAAYFPEARIAVLSNATRVSDAKTFAALKKVDDRILKLDAGTEMMFQRIDIPDKGITLDRVTEDLKRWNGDVIIQTLFLRGKYKNEIIDNTSPEEIDAWILRLNAIQPKNVMVYTIDRKTPVENLAKITKEELENIAVRVRELGIPAESF